MQTQPSLRCPHTRRVLSRDFSSLENAARPLQVSVLRQIAEDRHRLSASPARPTGSGSDTARVREGPSVAEIETDVRLGCSLDPPGGGGCHDTGDPLPGAPLGWGQAGAVQVQSLIGGCMPRSLIKETGTSQADRHPHARSRGLGGGRGEGEMRSRFQPRASHAHGRSVHSRPQDPGGASC